MGFGCLGHSNWTTCTPLSPFWFGDFSTFPLSYRGVQSYYPREPIMGKGHSPNFRIEWDRGAWVLGAFKLDHLHSFKPILVSDIFQLFHFHTGEPILITPERKGINPTSNLDETEGFGCLGHSNWTICSPLSPFCFGNFPTFSLSYWGANSYYPREPIMGKGSSPNFKTE